MKYILVIGDGMADHPLDTLGGRTPLEASKKDAIDALARHGILGSVRNVPEGFAPGSDTAIMSMPKEAAPHSTISICIIIGTFFTFPIVTFAYLAFFLNTMSKTGRVRVTICSWQKVPMGTRT